jgi:hypothetical protein
VPIRIGTTEYLSTAESAERLGVTASTLRTQRSDNSPSRLEFIRVGSVILYTAASVEREAVRRGAGR